MAWKAFRDPQGKPGLGPPLAASPVPYDQLRSWNILSLDWNLPVFVSLWLCWRLLEGGDYAYLVSPGPIVHAQSMLNPDWLFATHGL